MCNIKTQVVLLNSLEREGESSDQFYEYADLSYYRNVNFGHKSRGSR